MGIRRVVTGRAPDGSARFISDSEVDAVLPPVLRGNEIYELWGEDAVPSVPNDGERPQADGFYAPPGGYRFVVFRIPPASQASSSPDDEGAGRAESERLLPGLTQLEDPDGMHFTETIDLEMVVEGEVVLSLDSGEEKTIRAGESIVQCGVPHDWENRHPDQWASVLLVFVGATRADRP